MPDANTIPPLADVMARWHEFYGLLGTASATLVGLLFVAATVGSGTFTLARRAALRMFLSASVIHFSGILIVCLIVLAPGESWRTLGGMIGACGVFGVGYYGLAWSDTLRDGLNRSIAWDDRLWYAVLPVVGYLMEAGSGVALALGWSLACIALAVTMGFLLVVGIHNAWDITVWTISRPRE